MASSRRPRRSPVFEIEIICSDPGEHQRRVESRSADISGHRLPTWSDVIERDYQPWERDRLVVDTANLNVHECVGNIRAALSNHQPS